MDYVSQTFYETFTWQWAVLAIPIAFIFSLLVNRVIAAGIIAFIAVAAQHLWPVVWPLLQQSAANDAMMKAATEALQKINPLAAGMEWLAFTFFIAVFSLTRQDMFRVKPDH
jgi:hypothetical protein